LNYAKLYEWLAHSEWLTHIIVGFVSASLLIPHFLFLELT